MNVFKILSQKMAWLNQRQKLVSENIANANSPAYKTQDLKEGSFEKVLAGQKININATKEGHIGFQKGKSDVSFSKERIKTTFESKVNGNNVVLEQEMLKLSEISLQDKQMKSLFKKHLDMIKHVLRSTK